MKHLICCLSLWKPISFGKKNPEFINMWNYLFLFTCILLIVFRFLVFSSLQFENALNHSTEFCNLLFINSVLVTLVLLLPQYFSPKGKQSNDPTTTTTIIFNPDPFLCLWFSFQGNGSQIAAGKGLNLSLKIWLLCCNLLCSQFNMDLKRVQMSFISV